MPDSIRATPPTIRSRLSDLVAGALRPVTDERYARHVADRAAQAADWVPLLGNAMGAQENGQQAQRGYRSGNLSDLLLGASGVALSVLPGANAGKSAVRGKLEEFMREGNERFLTYTSHDGHVANMQVIVGPDGMAEISIDPFSKEAHRFGPAQLRAGAQMLRDLYPEIKGVWGVRETGAGPGRVQQMRLGR